MSLDDEKFENMGSAVGISPLTVPLVFMLAMVRMNPFLAPFLR